MSACFVFTVSVLTKVKCVPGLSTEFVGMGGEGWKLQRFTNLISLTLACKLELRNTNYLNRWSVGGLYIKHLGKVVGGYSKKTCRIVFETLRFEVLNVRAIFHLLYRLV